MAAKQKRSLKKKDMRACPRLRILIGGDMILGPGKIDLLDAIDRTGSISAAGREMGMSYRRAWVLVDALNHMFGQILVEAVTGGQKGGGARLTEFGRRVSTAYRRAEARSREVVEDELGPLIQKPKRH